MSSRSSNSTASRAQQKNLYAENDSAVHAAPETAAAPNFWTKELLQELSDAEFYGLFTPENLLPAAKAKYDAAISAEPLPLDKQIVVRGAKRKQAVRFEYVKSWDCLIDFMCDTGPQFPKELIDELLRRIIKKHLAMLEERAAFSQYVKTIPTPVIVAIPTLLMKLDPVARRKKAIRREAVADIVGFFDPNAFSVPVTTPVEISGELPGDDSNYIMANGDANHRVCGAVALKFDVIEKVEVLVDASALDRAQNMFNRNVPQTALAVSDAITVGLEARDPQITAAAQLIEAAGLVPLTNARTKSADPTKLGVPVNSIKSLADRFRTETIQRLLSLFNGDFESWGPTAADPKTASMPIMSALARLIDLERAGVVPTTILHAFLHSWSPTALENERNSTDKTKLRRWFPAAASVQSQESRGKLMLAVMLDKCHRLANPKSGISAAQIMQTAHGIPVDELTDEDMKHAASYKRTMKTLIETFRSNFKTLPPAEREKIAHKVMHARLRLANHTELPDWWLDNYSSALEEETPAGPLFD